VADLSPQRRVVVPDADIPATVRNGFVAVEDRRFWEHGGIDLRGIGRAIAHDLASLSFKEGFSTITMQLTRSLFPEELDVSQKSLRRKFCEVYLAGRIEREFSKREILNLYLNQINLGHGIYGVEMASEYYFGKPVKQVDPAEAALIVGINRNPGLYNPRKNPQRAMLRRNTVLELMARERVIAPAEAQRLKAEPIRLAPPPEAAGPAPFFVAEVRRELRERFGTDADVTGLRVYTGLDPALQQAARKALLAQITRIEAGKLGRWRHPVMPANAPASAGASPYLQGTIVAVDPHSGEIRALVGGRDFAESQYDRAYAKRQPGSAFKPIVYATAIGAGKLTASSRIETTPIGGAGYTPDDEVPDSVASLPAREALAKSSNNAAVRVGLSVGPQAVIQVAHAMGIASYIPPYPSIFLGAGEVTPLELVGAYAILDNGGVRVTPHLIQRVEDKKGKVLWRAPLTQEQAIDANVAFITLSMMQDVVNHGTGATIRTQGFQGAAAGKTGTTNDVKDVWFVGMTPGVVAGVWLGFDRPRTIMPGGFGGALAAPVWAGMMNEYYRTHPSPGGWEPPAGIVRVWVDAANGLLAAPGCPQDQVREEYFTPGTEPKDYCPLHGGNGGAIGKVIQGLRKIF
ncbi:MAG TPA: transglycosylase domain-containing protein, partial [Longimicrobiales bacterium]